MADTIQQETASAIEQFHKAVNMTPEQIEKWLETDKSHAVGQTKEGEDESIGHHSGRRIIEILHKKSADYTEDDIAHMRKVVSYIHRHLAQKPASDVTETHWRYSLMNWGHDPLQK